MTGLLRAWAMASHVGFSLVVNHILMTSLSWSPGSSYWIISRSKPPTSTQSWMPRSYHLSQHGKSSLQTVARSAMLLHLARQCGSRLATSWDYHRPKIGAKLHTFKLARTVQGIQWQRLTSGVPMLKHTVKNRVLWLHPTLRKKLEWVLSWHWRGVVGADLHPLGATCVNHNLKMCFLTNYTLTCYSYTLQIHNGMILFGSPKCY